MAFNPFLSMNEPAAPVAADVLNPFMMSDPESAAFTGNNAFSEDNTFTVDNAFTGDNPFATSNPFSDFGGGFEPAAGDTVPVDIFGGPDPPGGGARQFEVFTTTTPSVVDIFASQPPEPERLVKPTELELISTTADSVYCSPPGGRPALPTRPLPPETQNLILTVTGQMEFTSSDLLDRIPPTRTPSPVSARDIHSPSPTPEPELELDPEPAPVLAPPTPTTSAPVDNLDINRNKPARPPPARPPAPPRPAPPPPPQRPAAPVDDINLFDAPAPTVVKPTKEAILSLYSAPKKEEKQIDFLSDDISEDVSVPAGIERKQSMVPEVTTLGAEPSQSVLGEATLSAAVAPAAPEATLMFAASPALPGSAEATAPMDCSEPVGDVNTLPADNSPFADITNDNAQFEKNPFESIGDTNSTGNVFNTMAEDAFMAPYPETFESVPNNVLGTAPAPAPTSYVEHTTSDVFVDNTDMFGASTDAFPHVSHDAAAAWGASTDTFPHVSHDAAAAWGASTDTFPHVSHDAAAAWGASEAMVQDSAAFPESQDAFDAFSAKFDSTAAQHMNTAAWGDDGGAEGTAGFESEAFDPFLSMGAPPPPAATPRLEHQGSRESTDDTFSVFIRPKESETSGSEASVPVLAPPPRPHVLPDAADLSDLRPNPFDTPAVEPRIDAHLPESRRDSGGETPPTPLFDDDVSMPLETFPRTVYSGPGWEMHLRQPNKKKITGQRFWKKVFVRLAYQGDNPVVQLSNSATDKEPFQELPLQACYSVSEVGAQQFDQFGKIFTVKLQYVFYKERPGVRPGQVTKAERITNKLSQFAAYAIQGDYQGVKEFGSDLRKLGLPVEHAPQVSQLFKLGSLVYEDVLQFSCCIEESLFRLPAHRDRALTYKMEEVQITAVDELYVEQDAEGSVMKQIARVRLFFLGFLSGMPDVELGVNDLRRQGKEVVGRHDIIPVVTEEWIRVEDTEFHACVQPEEFTATQIIKFKPPDACYIELMRFRVRPPKNRELPLQLKAVWCVTGNKVELRADVLVPGFASRKLGQVPCEDVAIRFPIPECWIYLFRVEKHFRYGSVKSAHRRTGKIKGIERFLGAVDTVQESLIEVTSGQAKYEHQHRAIVWRMPRLPKEGQGAYTTHNLVSRMALTSYDQVPAELARWAHVEFTMPATQVSHMTVRSVSLQNHDNDPPEKYVRYLARHEYIVGIERTSGQAAPAYAVAASREAPCAPPDPTPAPAAPQPPSSDSDSD